jgi:hypothetical protein
LCTDHLSTAKLGSVALCTGADGCKILKKTNKEKKKKLVDVAPHWGEPHISCVDVLCAMLLMLFMLFIY